MDIIWQVEHHAPFSLLIVTYFFLAGMSAGLFILSSLQPVFGIEKFKAIAKPVSVMALATIIPGILALVIDLGQPIRFMTLLFRFNPTSVMSWGTYILTIYSIVCLGYIWTLWKDNGRSKVWGKVGIVFASTLGLYTGFLLAVVPGRPLWNSALVPVLFLVSGLVAALSLLSLIKAFFPNILVVDDNSANVAFHKFEIWFAGLEIVLLASHLLVLVTLNEAGREVAKHLLTGDRQISFLLVQIVIGMVIPMVLVLFNRKSSGTLGLAGLLSLIGVLALRFNFVIGGEELPQSGTLMYGTELGSNMIMLTIGLLVLAGILIYIAPKLVTKLLKSNTKDKNIHPSM